jgi:hypothetical protein
VLPAHDRRMDLEVLRHLEQLLRQGATIIGERPERTYGLRGFPAEEQDLRKLATRIWGEPSSGGNYERMHGRGRVVVGKAEREVLVGQGLGPDFDVLPVEARAQIDFIHRRTVREDIYFLRNAGSNDVHFEATFRVRGMQPELWDAVGGTMSTVAVFDETAQGTRLPMHLAGHGSMFVVFSAAGTDRPHIIEVRNQDGAIFPERPNGAPGIDARRASDGTIVFCAAVPGRYELRLSDGSARMIEVVPDAAPIELTGPWEVRFPRGWDVPVRQEFTTLHSWTDSINAATRSFSGIAAYAKQFQLSADQLPSGRRVVLDLGEVREVARVYLNGRELGLSSFAPHVLDVTDVLRSGENSLLIEVANTWLNRLIADDALPEGQGKTYTNLPGPVAGQRWRDAQPKASGLLGPVRLCYPAEVFVNPKQP